MGGLVRPERNGNGNKKNLSKRIKLRRKRVPILAHNQNTYREAKMGRSVIVSEQ